MSNRCRLLALGLSSLFFLGCGSGDDSSDGGLDLSTGSTSSGFQSSGNPSDQQASPAKRVKSTKEELLDRDIRDIIVQLERGKTEIVVIDYTDPYTLSQVKIHDATFPEKKSLQKLYDGFRDNLAEDLLADLKAAQSLEPEILEQDDGAWYSAYYFDKDTMSSEIVFAIDPEVDKNWVMIELPLTLPWGNQQAQSDEWKQWEAVATQGKPIRYLDTIDFDPHANPATVVLGMRKSFQNILDQSKHDLRSYGSLLSPESRKIHAAILVKSILLSKEFAPRVDDVIALFQRYDLSRDGIDDITFPRSQDVAFYSAFAQRFPEGTDFIRFIEEASSLYEEGKGKKLSIHYPFQGSSPLPIADGDRVEASIEWQQIDSKHKPTMKTRFTQIDGKWFVESYWEALARHKAEGQ